MIAMTSRRPLPEGFDEDMDLLIQLQAQRAELDARIDDVFVRVAIEKSGPTSVIAERLKVQMPAVSERRRVALRRQQQRQRAQQVPQQERSAA